jgi:hypothetical protein
VAFEILYVSDFFTKLCRQQAEVIQNHHSPKFQNKDKAKPNRENVRGLNLMVKVTAALLQARLRRA